MRTTAWSGWRDGWCTCVLLDVDLRKTLTSVSHLSASEPVAGCVCALAYVFPIESQVWASARSRSASSRFVVCDIQAVAAVARHSPHPAPQAYALAPHRTSLQCCAYDLYTGYVSRNTCAQYPTHDLRTDRASRFESPARDPRLPWSESVEDCVGDTRRCTR